MTRALCFLVFVAFALQVHGLELESVRNAVHNLFSDSREEETEAIKFKCAKDGLYPNPRNCSTFIQCSNGIPHLMNCSTGLHFSNKTKRCEGVCDAHCDLTQACKCDWKSCGKEICFLPPKTGQCFAKLPRYYFDKRDGQCKRFIYGGCNGNQNNFLTKEECEKRCGNVLDVCKLPKETGPCHGAIPRYYFNIKTGKCEKFLYGGCKGNGNNFETKEQCDRKCLKKLEEEEEEIDVEVFKCAKDGLYPNRRNCSSYIQCTNGRPIVMPCPSGLHFSAKNKTCESPCDAHCDRTLACKCEWKTCGTNLTCHLPPKTGPCRAHIPRYYFNQRTGECKPFTYGGCHGNENNFETKESCLKYCGRSTDICKLPRVIGPCNALVTRWWYNAISKKCEVFKYGGCGGNANNFETKERCELRCEKKSEEEEADLEIYRCRKDGLYPNRRNCSSFIQCTNGRPIVMPCPAGLHFSVRTQKCEEPCVAHCDKTLACKCQWKTCGTKFTCYLPPKTGICRAHLPRYYFDKRSGVCKLFVYGGCNGNENNFQTKDECEKYCGNYTDVCKLPKEVGPCRAGIPRWYFNSQANKCEKFTYGGCQGNGNNFKTLEDCEKRCPKKEESESEEAADFKCEKDGLHPIKRNCSAFIQCTNGRPVVMPCPPGLHFSVKTQKCEQPCDAHCDKTLACQCKWKACGGSTCLLPAQTGTCKAYKPRYYYDKRTGLCKPFVYSGCLGNENNFPNKEECEKICGQVINICRFPAAVGECHAHKERYFFNKKTGKCQKFIYGGCGGNANNFETVKACELRCLRKSGEPEDVTRESEEDVTSRYEERVSRESEEDSTRIYEEFTSESLEDVARRSDEDVSELLEKKRPECKSPPEKGKCRGSIERWYYNKKEGKCIKFIYGGCGGNGNNYKTERDCLKRCSKRSEEAIPEYCKLPAEKGPCKGHIEKYYYDSEEGECKTFIYGGCSGNRNSFFTKELCEKSCKKSEEEISEEISEEIERSEAESLVCPEPNGDFPYHRDCKKYIRCKGGKPELKDCPKGKEFDFILRKCVPAGEAACAR